jgi:uncharacterized RDD family membrane protein YckC
MDDVTVASTPQVSLSVPPTSRRQRGLAVAIDAATLLVALVITTTVAVGWLLARTETGRLEVRDADARLAAALVLAVPPTWLAWLVPGVARGATPGQRRAHLEVRGSLVARVNRLALHPLALLLWGWLALTAFAFGTPRLGVAVAFLAAFVLALGLGSFVLWMISPTSRALHDRLARTRLVRTAPPESPR